MKLKLEIEGMSCEHCVSAVAKALSNVKGISSSDVTIGSAIIEVDSTVTEEYLKEVIDDIGFEITGITIA